MKKILIVLAVIIFVFFTVGIFKDGIIKSVVTVAATQVTGAPVHIDGFSFGIFNQSVWISGFKMYNPQGFSKGILVDLPTIHVTYDLGALLKKKLHLTNVEVEIKEMGLEKNKIGQLNADELKVVKEGKKEKGQSAQQMLMQIDVLKLGIGKIVLKDYSLAQAPTVKVYDINIHKNYKNISSAQQLSLLILSEPMKEAGIQGAKIYGVAMVAGVAILPVAIAATFAGKDSAQQNFSSDFNTTYETSLGVLKRMGTVTKEDKTGGVISAEVSATQVVLRLKKDPENKTTLTVSARKFLLPKPEIAGGVLYEISQKLR